MCRSFTLLLPALILFLYGLGVLAVPGRCCSLCMFMKGD
jgi:hypothetical protein